MKKYNCYKCQFETDVRADYEEHVISPEHKNKFKGGFSEDVFNARNFQSYIESGHVCGYIGDGHRTIRRDKLIEQALRATGLGNEGIATWLTSGDGRHMMDNVERKTTEAEFSKLCQDHCNYAFQKVTIWSHPDHQGNLKSSNDIAAKIYAAFKGAL